MSDLDALIGEAFGMLEEVSAPDVFQIAGQPVAGVFTGGTVRYETDERSRAKKRIVEGLLVVSKKKLPEAPDADAIITGPDQARYRINQRAEDSVSWTFRLATPA